MTVEFNPAADLELGEAIAYYNEARAGLGEAFLFEVRKAVDRIVAMPNAWAMVSRRARRCRVRRFPYGVVYRKTDSLIRIIAVMHLHRKPGYWKDRK
jgi:hypothetical protein